MCVVLGSPVSRLQKNRDRTGSRPPRTGNSQDCQRPQPRSGLWSLRILEISRPRKDQSNRSQPVFRPKTLPNYNIYVNTKQNFIVSEIIINIFPVHVEIMMGNFLNSSHPFSLSPPSCLSLTSFYTVWNGQQRLLGAIGECHCPSNIKI